MDTFFGLWWGDGDSSGSGGPTQPSKNLRAAGGGSQARKQRDRITRGCSVKKKPNHLKKHPEILTSYL